MQALSAFRNMLASALSLKIVPGQENFGASIAAGRYLASQRLPAYDSADGANSERARGLEEREAAGLAAEP